MGIRTPSVAFWTHICVGRVMIRRILMLGICLAFVVSASPVHAESVNDVIPDAGVSAVPDAAPFVGQASSSSGEPSWIVTMKAETSAGARALSMASITSVRGVSVEQVFKHVINGFSFTGSDQVAEVVRRSPNVASVEPNRILHATAERASFGLFRIDGELTFAAGDRGLTEGGIPVRIAILDTGIDTNHPDLSPNLDLSQSINCITPGSPPEDDHGHGTHVAGIAAAADQGAGLVGVASQATIVAAKVLNDTGSGTDAQVICGLDHIAALAADGIPTVVNLSLGELHAEGAGCASSALHQAICNLTDANVTVVAASGNDGVDATSFYPAAYPETIAVSAFADFDKVPGGLAIPACPSDVDSFFNCDDTIASFSNYGTAIDVAAPGVRILSTTFNGGEGVNSGTSMAAPYVSGVAALVLARNPTLNPGQVRSMLQTTGECPDGSTSAAVTCAGHGQWEKSNGLFGTVPDPDGIPEPLVNAFEAVAATTPGLLRALAPTGVVAIGGDGFVDLSWDANAELDVTGYAVYRSEVAGSIDPTSDAPVATVPLGTEQYQDADVVNGTTYHYVVTALDDDPSESVGSPQVDATPNAPSGAITLTADNAFEVFVNGVSVGSGSDWQLAQVIPQDLGTGDVIAVAATDAGGIAGFLAEMVWDGGSAVSDGSWRVAASAPAGWETPGFDDSGWAAASTYGTYGVAPWNMNVAGFPAGRLLSGSGQETP